MLEVRIRGRHIGTGSLHWLLFAHHLNGQRSFALSTWLSTPMDSSLGHGIIDFVPMRRLAALCILSRPLCYATP